VSVNLLLRDFERIAYAPDAISRVRLLIVELALRGDFSPARGSEFGSVEASRRQIARGMESLLRTRPNYRRQRMAAPIDGGVSVPDGWCTAALDDTGLYVNGIVFKPSDWCDTGRPIIRIQNLSGLNRDYHFASGTFPEDNIAQPGDLLVSWSATLDAFIWPGPEGLVNQHIFKVIPNPEAVTPRFLYWLLKHEVRQLARSQHAHGVAMMHINRGPFLAHTIILPPLSEQQRIVTKVEEMMALCEDIEAIQREDETRRAALRAESLQRLIRSDQDEASIQEGVRFFLGRSRRLITKPDHVAAMRQTILDLAVRGRLVPQDPSEQPATEILHKVESNTSAGPAKDGNTSRVHGALPWEELPAGWVSTAISQVFKVTGGIQKQPKRTPVRNSYPYLGVSNVQRGRLDLSFVARFELFPGELEKLRLEAGDLLVVEGNGSATEIGRCARWDGEITDCVHQNHIIRCRPLLEGLEKFALVYLNSPSGTAIMRELAITSAGLYSLSVGKIQRITIPLPPLAEQYRIVAKVDELMTVCDELAPIIHGA
jgi:type I restriction enzyme S subunit